MPGTQQIMRLDDTYIFSCIYKQEEDWSRYITQALIVPSRKILELINPNIQGNTKLELLQSAWDNGCLLRDRNLIVAAIQEIDLESLMFLLNCVGKDFFIRADTLLHPGLPRANATNEFNNFVTEYFPNYYKN